MDAAHINRAISVLETHRDVLGNSAVDAALHALHRMQPALHPEQPVAAREITVLAAQISGMLPFGDALAAQDAIAFTTELWQRLSAKIEENRGEVVACSGYTLVAVFGADAPRQNEAEWAIRAALDIQRTLARIRQEWVEKQSPPAKLPPLNVSLGLHTGEVLWRTDETRRHAEVWGDAVEIARALAIRAFPRRILISAQVYRQVRGVFYVQQLPQPVDIPVLPTTVRAFEVKGAKPYAVRVISHSIEGMETSMVGRAPAMQALQSAFETAATGTAQLVTISGASGMGKSRLLYEFDQWLEEQPRAIRLLQGRASLPTRHLPYWIFRDIFTFYFGIFASDTTETTRKKLSQGILSLTETADGTAEAMAARIERLIGFSPDTPLPYPSAPAHTAFSAAVDAVNRFFAMLATPNSPVVLMLEDIHWADDASLRLLKRLWHASRNLPLMIVCTTQPQLFERQPDWFSAEDSQQQKSTLPPLTPAQSAELIAQIFRKIPVIPEKLQAALVTHAGGNPLLLEELIQLLIDDDVILPLPIRWRVDEHALSAVQLPTDLHAVLQSRFARLPALEQEMLQRAAAIGRAFWNVALAQMSESHAAPISVEVVNVVLENLQERGLILQRESSPFAQTREYIFKHASLRQAIYDTLPATARISYHTQLADWLIEFNGEQVDAYAALIAAHFEAAEKPVESATWLARAGKQALSVFAWDVALGHFQKAERVLSAVPPSAVPAELPPNIAYGQSLALWWQAETATAGEQPSLFEAALAQAEKSSAPDLQSRVLHHWANAEKKRGNSARAASLLKKAQSILP